MYVSALEKSRTQMLHRPESVDHLTILELHLLMNDNDALNLDPHMVTYPQSSPDPGPPEARPHRHQYFIAHSWQTKTTRTMPTHST